MDHLLPTAVRNESCTSRSGDQSLARGVSNLFVWVCRYRSVALDWDSRASKRIKGGPMHVRLHLDFMGLNTSDVS